MATADAVDTAKSLHPLFKETSYPIYVAWETGAAFGLFPPRAPDPKPKHFLHDPTPEATNAPYPLGNAERRLEMNTRAIARSMWGRTKNFARYTNDPDHPQAAMNRFMRAFVPLWKERGLRVVVIAHSAGALFTGHWLEALETWNPTAKVDVMLLAPACTFAFVERRLAMFKKHVQAFRMLSLSEATERYDALLRLKLVPKSLRGWYDASMLYFISNNLEGSKDVPLLGMERFFRMANGEAVVHPRELSAKEFAQIRRVSAQLDLGGNTVWSNGPKEAEISPFPGVAGWECRSPGHVGFWLDEASRRSMRAFALGVSQNAVVENGLARAGRL